MSELPNERSILNIFGQEIATYKLEMSRWVSVGIHPWYAQLDTWENQLRQLESLVLHPAIKMVGECGLDRLIPLSLEKQLNIFDAQVQMAERVKKPVVIHCVRAFNELLQWHKHRRTQVPLILHGFNNQSQIARQLLQKGFYFSLGGALLRQDSNASVLLRELPLERLFLENDDRDIPIQTIYQAAAEYLQCSTGQLKSQIWSNFARLFSQE